MTVEHFNALLELMDMYAAKHGVVWSKRDG